MRKYKILPQRVFISSENLTMSKFKLGTGVKFKTDLQNDYQTALRECFNKDPKTWKTIRRKCNTSRYLHF